ncbi:hypothetical protein HN709_04995, partial [Candidatus Peregrinibacteria bacterium]|nr:hypothetical protein [Candidatus Peregrinibacteria bacterium]
FENVSDESLGKIRSIYIEYHEGGGRGVDSIVDRLRGGGFKVEKKVSFYDSSMGFVLGKRV